MSTRLLYHAFGVRDYQYLKRSDTNAAEGKWVATA